MWNRTIVRSRQCLFRVDQFAAKHGQVTTVGAGGSRKSYGWISKALQLGKALGLVEDMPTARSRTESEYRYTDRGSEAKRKEDVKENRCPLGHGRRH